MKGKNVLVDPATAAAAIFDRLNKAGAKVRQGPDPCQLPKACKNSLEIEGTRKALSATARRCRAFSPGSKAMRRAAT